MPNDGEGNKIVTQKEEADGQLPLKPQTSGIVPPVEQPTRRSKAKNKNKKARGR